MSFESKDYAQSYRRYINFLDGYEPKGGKYIRGVLERRGEMLPLFRSEIRKPVKCLNGKLELRNFRQGEALRDMDVNIQVNAGIQKTFLVNPDRGIIIVNDGNVPNEDRPVLVHLFESSMMIRTYPIPNVFTSPGGILYYHTVLETFDFEGYTVVDSRRNDGDENTYFAGII